MNIDTCLKYLGKKATILKYKLVTAKKLQQAEELKTLLKKSQFIIKLTNKLYNYIYLLPLEVKACFGRSWFTILEAEFKKQFYNGRIFFNENLSLSISLSLSLYIYMYIFTFLFAVIQWVSFLL